MSRALLLGTLALVLSAAACGGSSTSPSTDTTTPTLQTELFAGDLGVGDSQFYSFTTNAAGTSRATLVSLRPVGVTGSAVSTVVGLGIGTPQGTGCSLSAATNTAPALVAQVSVATNTSIYCVAISDVGFLNNTTSFAVRITHP